jgi:general stress protein YciG
MAENQPHGGGSGSGAGSGRGFAAMDEARQRKIASKGGHSVPDEKRSFSKNPGLAAEAGRKGGQVAHEKGTAHEFTPEEAREAGRKGGEAVSQDRVHMSQIGKKGGESRGS